MTGFRKDTYNGYECLSARLPEGVTAFSDFYVNGKRAAYTRYPTEGYLYPDDVENHEGQLFSGSDWFIAHEGDIPTDLRNPKQVIISFCHYWIDEHTPIESYDPETRCVRMQYRSRFNIDGGKGTASGLEYYLENVGETFGNHRNEWYRDGDTVYYIPRCTIADCTIDTCGRRYFAACGILMMHTWGCVAEHNEIGNLYYTGISCGWVWGYQITMRTTTGS